MNIAGKNDELTHGHVRFSTTWLETLNKLLKIYKWSQFTCADDWYYYLGNSQYLSKSKIIHIIAILQKILVVGLNSLLMILPKQVVIRADVKNTMLKEVDKLWSLHKDEFQFTNVRDSRYLNWMSKSKTIYYIYYKNEMKGFIVLNTYKKKSVMLVDYWCPDIANYAKPILNFLLRKYKDYNLIIPSYNKKFRKAAMSCLLIKRKKSQDLDFIHFGKEKPIEHDRCFLTMMQGNRSLLLSNSG